MNAHGFQLPVFGSFVGSPTEQIGICGPEGSAEANARRSVILAWVMWIALGLCAIGSSAAAAQDLVKTGTLQIEQVQVAFIGSGNLGGGALNFAGGSYRFKIGGLGVGGIGISKMTATGNVYNLKDVAYFPGAYLQLRTGVVVGDLSRGKLWLKNSNGVVLELWTERRGLALSLGGDAVYIDLD
jgi:hypothetical protein